MLEKEEDSGVCRAVVDGFPVVIKFVVSCDPRRIKAIRDEGTIYFERLEDLQGVAIPCLYACFKGTLLVTTEDRDFTSSVLCLFLEDCGDVIDMSFLRLLLSDRVQIIRKLGMLHLCNVNLLHFAKRNVVHKKGDYRLVDFQDINDKHTQCGWGDGVLYEGEPEPNIKRIGCEDLHDAASEMDIWKPSANLVTIAGKTYVRSINGLPDQGDVDKLCGPSLTCSSERRDKLLLWLIGYTEFKGKMTPEQYMKKHKRPPTRN